MSNNSQLRGKCPAPFFDESKFPSQGGYIKGRICADLPGQDLTCCLPCPAPAWLYPDSFYGLTRIAGFVAIGSIACCLFVLLAFLLLPEALTKRHYLNTCLLISIVCLELGLAVPVLVKPEQCANSITPNDMSNSWTCAWSGALIVVGGCASNMWILMRVLSMHLQICWDIKPARTFFWTSQLAAWGVTAAVTAVCLSITGVSFRFGDYCHVNNYKGLQTLWGPLLGFAGLSLSLQATTCLYCIKVYLQNYFDDRTPSGLSGPVSTPSSNHIHTARAVYKRVRRVLILQWRSLLISALVAADVTYLAIVFVVLNAKIEHVIEQPKIVFSWVYCIVLSKGDVDKCLPYATPLRPRNTILIATLILLSIIGIQVCLLVGKWEMVTGWRKACVDWRRKRRQRHAFVNLDPSTESMPRNIALATPGEEKTVEMSKFSTPATTTTEISPTSTFKSPTSTFKSPTSTVQSPTSDTKSPIVVPSEIPPPTAPKALNPPQAEPLPPSPPRSPLLNSDFDLENGLAQARLARNWSLSRRYQPPSSSFSSPRPPSSSRSIGYPESTATTAPASRPSTADTMGLGFRAPAFFSVREGAVSRAQR